MTLSRFGFENGSNGDTMTATLAGASGVTNTDSGTITISTAQAHAGGTRSALFNASATSGARYVFKTIADSDIIAYDIYMYWTTLPTNTDTPILYVGNGATRYASANIISDGRVRLNVNGVAVWTSTAVISIGQWYRFSLYLERSTTAGKARLALFNDNDATPLSNGDSGLLTGLNTGASVYNQVRFGSKATTAANGGSVYFDDYGIDLAPTGLNAPIGSTPPSLGTPVIDDAYARVDMSGATYSVGPGSLSASPSTGVVASGNQIFLPRDPAGATTTYTITATDTGNGASASTTVDVPGITASVAGHAELVTYDGSTWS